MNTLRLWVRILRSANGAAKEEGTREGSVSILASKVLGRGFCGFPLVVG